MPRTKAKRPQGHTSEGNGKRTPDLAYIAEPLRSLAVAIQSLSPDPANARTHPERNLDAIRGSLALFGQVKPVVVRKETGTVVCGNGTLAAAQALGWTHLAAVIKSMDQATATALAIADNQTAALAEWDNEVLDRLLQDLVTGQPEVDAMLAALAVESNPDYGLPEPGAGGDEFDATPDDGPTRTQTGDLWIIGGKHRLLCGDSTKADDVARLMGGEKAGMIVTSPPYNQSLETFTPSGMQKESPSFVNRMQSSYHDSRPEEEYQSEQCALLIMLAEYLATNGSIFYNHKIRYRDKRIVSPLEWLLKLPFAIRQEIIWDRGSSITLNARMFIPADERIYWIRVGDDFTFNDDIEIKSWSTVWKVAARNEVQISAAFSVEIPTRCIRAASVPSEIVLEPYCGSGTTLIAAHRLGRRCYGIEIEPKYCDVILKRAEAEGLTVEKE